ncbi:MAG TPA: UDP-N-acetylglucosamine 2-epimerase (non-hydrolyzing) [Nitrospiraceae bacterium]|jgi:UDP-N-acetylglucosamine 2-epimerase (non-hydrolysing)|nr:UDP-N-acetylglucosamine 2-epimerase (non-hydrolyzing) [Nitrospiraceae bacterium]
MKVLFFFGTRPEAVKMAPLIKEFQKYQGEFDVRICVSAQHREMLDQVLSFFDIKPHYDLNIMKSQQTLFEITAATLSGIREVLQDERPDWLLVQGDTTTTFVGALAAFYEKIKVCHLEAGLRSFHKYSPFPEEMNRVLTSHIADIHLVPTERAKRNLLRESISEERIHLVGNTVIDALFLGTEKVEHLLPDDFSGAFDSINFSDRVILVTGHRRESFGKPFMNICHALRTIADTKEVSVVYPVHLNPHVRKPVFEILAGVPNIHLIEPLDYPSFIWLMNRSYFILTDSGGVQEEAPSLGKPVLVMRDVTERTEGIDAGTAKLVGTDPERIVEAASLLLDHREEYERMAKAVNPYGDGKSSERIRNIFLNTVGLKKPE